MSVSHGANTRNAIADAVLAEIDIDVGAGTLELHTAGDVEVATMTLSDPAGTVSGATLTFDPLADDINATGGITTKFVIKSNGGTVRLSGSVGALLSGADIEMSTTNIAVGKTVSITALTYNAPP